MTTESGLAPAAKTGAPELVLVSGMLGDESLWHGVLGHLALTAGVRCLRSDSCSTVREMAEAVLDAAPPSFALAGHSFGGIVALEVQRQAPDRVSRLALLGASARAGSATQQEGWSALRSRTVAGEFTTVAAELAAATLPAHHRTPENVEQNLAMAIAVGSSGLLRQLAAQAGRPDSRPGLATIAVPTTVVIGDHDEVCPPDLQREVASGIPGAVTEFIAGAGHMSPIEAPQQVAEVLRTWLSAPAAPRHPVTRAPDHPRPSSPPDRKDPP